ncbi:MAG TPA: hypothetical protein VG710_04595 [Opitutus sp.]|nr:hypothetical protein [Opitutus sp.]
MPPMQRAHFPVQLSLIAAATAFALGGCSSAGRRDRFSNEAITARPVVAMRGDGMYFDGKLKAELTVSRGRTMPFGETAGGEGHGGGRSGGGHSRRHHRDESEISDSDSGSDSDADSEVHPIHMMNSALAVTLRLKLQNVSKEAFDVQIRDIKSDLGDFAVRPERMLLAPDQSGELDPMVSELGVTSDEIPVTVTLHAAGKTETQDILVKNLFTPATEK